MFGDETIVLDEANVGDEILSSLFFLASWTGESTLDDADRVISEPLLPRDCWRCGEAEDSRDCMTR